LSALQASYNPQGDKVMFEKLINFIRDSINEVKRVTWPTREQVIGGTLAVILVSTVLVIYMWIADLIITRLLSLVMR